MRTIGKLSGNQMGQVVRLLTQYAEKNGKTPEIVTQVNSVVEFLKADIAAIPAVVEPAEVK